MFDTIRLCLRRWLVIPPDTPSTTSAAVIEHYEEALQQLTLQPDSFLTVLLARDSVAQGAIRNGAQVQQVTTLDTQFQQAGAAYLKHLPNWRRAVGPPSAAWWWYLDEAADNQRKKEETREQEKDVPWVIVTGVLMLLTTTLAVDLIRRLWTEAPDTLAIFGTLLTLLLTASPLTKRGAELMNLFLEHVLGLAPRYRGEATTILAGVTFVIVGLAWWLGRPQLAVLYNNWGIAELTQGNVTTAEDYFQSAGALDPALAVPYQNLADVYNSIGQPKTALEWYEKAIASDHKFGPAYASASHLHNEQGDYDKAITVALAGLYPDNGVPEPDVALKAKYDLLSNLGRAYFEQEQYPLAEKPLTAAVDMESDLTELEKKVGGQLRSAIPHIYLAQLFEQQNKPKDAEKQWQKALSQLDAERWDHQRWLLLVQAHLK